jgi:DNA-directed RNA polymerase III subunit RPC11
MVYFCPQCCNLLLTEPSPSGNLRFYCKTCPYIFAISGKITKKVSLSRKEVDDVLGGPDAWKNVEQTDGKTTNSIKLRLSAKCEKCGHTRAFFMMIQIRSADEPMSIFYKCSSCGHRWREG